MLKRLPGTSVAAERPSTNIFQKDSVDTASCGNRKENPMIATSSILRTNGTAAYESGWVGSDMQDSCRATALAG